MVSYFISSKPIVNSNIYLECLAAPFSAAKLSIGELDVVMKYTFRSLETGKDSPQLLKVVCVRMRACECAGWSTGCATIFPPHAHAAAAAGVEPSVGVNPGLTPPHLLASCARCTCALRVRSVCPG